MLSFIEFYRSGHTCFNNPRRAFELSLILGSLVPTDHVLCMLGAGLAGKGNRRSELSLTLKGAWLLSHPLFFLTQQGIRFTILSRYR